MYAIFNTIFCNNGKRAKLCQRKKLNKKNPATVELFIGIYGSLKLVFMSINKSRYFDAYLQI